MMKTEFSGHSHPITRDYDILRCDKCKELMEIPKEDLEYTCECGCEYSFVLEEVNGTDS